MHLLILVRRRSMPRRGWTTMEVPDGWLQLIRGPRPKSESWPLRTPSYWRTGGQGTSSCATCNGSSSACKCRVGSSRSPGEGENIREGVGSDVRLELSSGEGAPCRVEGSASSGRPNSAVRIFHCKVRAAAERARRPTSCEEELLTEARAWLERLQSEAMQSRTARLAVTPDAEGELTRLRAQVVELQGSTHGSWRWSGLSTNAHTRPCRG